MPKNKRITVLVSEETYLKWESIVERDKKNSKKRYYPAHTLKRLVDADDRINKAFGDQEKVVKKNKLKASDNKDVGSNYELFE